MVIRPTNLLKHPLCALPACKSEGGKGKEAEPASRQPSPPPSVLVRMKRLRRWNQIEKCFCKFGKTRGSRAKPHSVHVSLVMHCAGPVAINVPMWGRKCPWSAQMNGLSPGWAPGSNVFLVLVHPPPLPRRNEREGGKSYSPAYA